MKQELTKKFFEQRRAELDSPFNEIKADLQELADYFYPRSVRFLAKNVNKTNKRRNKKILDSTPITAVRNFSSGMMSGATSPAQNWFRFKIRNYNMENDHEVKSWCAQVEKLMRDAFNASKIYTKLPIIYKQLGVFGFAALSLESDYDDIFVCKVLPIGSYRYAKNYKGQVDTFVREYSETAKNIVEQFGEENVSDSVKNANRENPHAYFELIHFVMPNPNFDTTKVWAKNKKYISVYYEKNSTENKFLSESGFDKFPYVVFEAETNGEDVYPSDCPGINALPDVKQLFEMIKEYAKAIKKIVSPPLKGPAKYKDKTISDVLNMTVEEACDFFSNIPSISRKMETLRDVGLGYIRLGQPSTELSGGEAQRIKLAAELSKRSTGKTIYILDEPTTGLHFADVHKLVDILARLTEGGNTVIVIEHNLEVIKTADYIIDMGPEGGEGGGTMVTCGTPEEVAAVEESYTGKYLKKYLNPDLPQAR